ncbi:MAG: hypothetical protein A3F47_00255 [Candidatus Staskawiczbacteria bacterium RIFCSPHIGHO2_12_FULL_38_11]|uniref:Uncharacterized protein n=1 Tax=Candidatus Staskawiczbacteria bacterium RIFCSPHIGHO2_12_FULL_38_11 TaxID=1802209 RepID=A0A1G2I772_9BACT|nr:MAG: hypothetical protein A3F47_00255 [Candidatus Staskawiczbacteria bacterium RIFCSPHIGHO2_12_FULL_38_11]
MAKKVIVNPMAIATAEFDVIRILGQEWSLLTRHQDQRSANLKEVDFFQVDYVTCLIGSEPRISGWEKLDRLNNSTRIRHGSTVFMGLWKDYKSNKKNSILELLYHREQGITYVDFMGDVLEWKLFYGSFYYVLFFVRCDDGWRWGHCNLDGPWSKTNFTAVSSEST